MKFFLTILLVVALTPPACPAFAREFRIVTLSSPPLAYEEKGQAAGLATEVVREAFRRMGHSVSIVVMPWKRALHAVRFAEADAVFYAIHNSDREAWFHYSDEPLVVETTVMVRRAGSHVKLTLDKHAYESYVLGVGRGYYYGPKLGAFLDKARFAKVEEATTIGSNFRKLETGRLDVFLADLLLAQYHIDQNDAGDVVEIVRDEQGNPVVLDAASAFLAFSKATTAPKLAIEFSRILKEIKKDGTYSRIFGVYAP
jgi:polar amino acid transport system substrate-binding protein